MAVHHTRRRVLLAVVAVLLAAVGVVVVLFVTREQPGEQTVDDAIDEFRGEGGTASTSDPDSERPAAGVYAAEGEGQASLSSLGLTQSDGPDVPITVTHEGDDCWALEMSLNEEHRQTNHLCRAADGTITEGTSRTDQQWDLGALTQDNVTEFTCDPPAVVVDPSATPGDSWDQSCTGTNTGIDGVTTSEGPDTYLGRAMLEVSGEQVTTWHHRQVRTISGAQEGDQVIEHWYAVDTGLLVREERRSEVGSDSPIGTITYTEQGWWQLTSLEPRT